MKIVKIIGWTLILGFVVIQFFPVDHNTSYKEYNGDFMAVNQVPEQVKTKISGTCYDCHSNNTDYPWYSSIQPGAWYMAKHIKNGKAELNFNEWSDYSKRRQNSKLRSIISQIEDGEMPLESYTLIHRDATFSDKDKETVLAYFKKLKDNLNY